MIAMLVGYAYLLIVLFLASFVGVRSGIIEETNERQSHGTDTPHPAR